MSGWPKPGGSKSSSASKGETDLESGLEAQNDSHLNDLHSKLQALRGVTSDIYNDARGQNDLLDTTSNAFDTFKHSLSNTSSRFTRSLQSGKGNARYQLGIAAAVVSLFLLYKIML